ncbi:MAG TPA: PD-(D/E)XK nuclease family protein [Dehalococcoidia bacterium]|nr:PD-(D/E)XK nuclease family protein [Dehalococcoidia bacterium]
MPVYSHSQLSMYEDCPLKYKLRYRDDIKRDIEGIDGFLGSRVHETLQKCYDDLRFTKLNSLNDLLAYYNKIWQENWHDSIIITRQELTQEHYRALGEKLIETYYKRYSPFDTDITIGTELSFNFSLDDDDKYRLRGIIDRLSRTQDDVYEIHDYKTSKNLPGQQEADKDKQLGLYQIGVQKRWPDVKSIKLIWHYLAFDTELVSYRTPEAISSLVQDTKDLIDEIESAQDFPPKESWLCDWCEYPDLCPRRKHFLKVEALPVNEYLNEPGVTLVNKYVTLRNEKTKIEGEMEKVREAMFDYARKEEVEVIKGSDCKALVKFGEKLKFPGKNDAERPELDDIVKGAGKWDEVSQLDTTSLVRVVENSLWSKDLIDKVMKYGRIEETDSIHISKLKEEK